MKYLKFVVKNYRAIIGPLEVDVSRPKLTPIVGVNESGKTTVLHALYAFDCYNDDSGLGARHLRDTANLYQTDPPDATVTAVIALTRAELVDSVRQCESDARSEQQVQLLRIRLRRGLPNELTITRNLTSNAYSISEEGFGDEEIQDLLAREMLLSLPYTLFFDDFRDKVDERVEIVQSPDAQHGGWLAILEQLFKRTDSALSVFKLPTLEERQRKTVLAKVMKRLNETLTSAWQNFKLDERDALKVAIDFVSEKGTDGAVRHYLKLDVVEEDVNGDKHYFFISDRSKGFYWFFNFVMKLEFNPKVVAGSGPTIYLLDEPGSYLHARAQQRLCEKLRQLADANRVVYCTHSHYLLDPEVIPVASVMIASKNGSGEVRLQLISEFDGDVSVRRSALQPVLDALQMRPFALDLIGRRVTVVVEGIYDYFCLEMFRREREVAVLPSVNADSVKYYLSLLLAWQVEFRALWDHDEEGQRRYAEAAEAFGDQVTANSLRILPAASGTKRIMQNLIDGSDMTLVREELGLASNCAFNRTIQALFYSPRRAEIVAKIGKRTWANFDEVYRTLEVRDHSAAAAIPSANRVRR